ncbi:MAG: hypothetical protein L0K07_01315 [Yaniella sp.]|uniref:hypothetical protein n=1 Tax=Yaniella sp. TaxID=2773929 RepID=UPI0026489EDB|nr:hypothetical protein [Yaniella sp.]MDN5731031.1 hypothetical protein [Yaniella sp.]MDN5742293.1 hypothetical protein [Yaniella sp.]MDN5815045.1 hypothetical protein [Yaniella sp.]MDN5817679.1 hypothetical protein [Yaniella sp.]MDN5838184.1 hypothetical protein [Yaniella sp.]
MDTEHWVPITRGSDGETVGYLEPLDPEFTQVQPRPVLGHSVGALCDFVTGEERLLDHGIRELAEQWRLVEPELPYALTVLEVSPNGIVVADALKTKALIPTETFRVAWPDVTQRLVLWNR